jgi:hypothetical protein
VIVNLVPEFLAVLGAPPPGRDDAYRAYLERHRAVLSSYWHNYVIDLDAPPARGVIKAALGADRRDLIRLLAEHDLEDIASRALAAAQETLAIDLELDVYLMVGVGAANAGELVVGGRGIIVLCVEHFTGVANPETYALGLAPALLPMWIAHEAAHLVRYLAPDSRAGIRRLIQDSGVGYDCWDLASRASLRELLVNEGIAVHAARAANPGLHDEDYFGFTRRQYRRLRELETFLFRAVRPELDHTGLGLRLRWLTGGMSPAARLVEGRVLPERGGYYLGARMTEALVTERGAAFAARAAAEEFAAAQGRGGADRAVGA